MSDKHLNQQDIDLIFATIQAQVAKSGKTNTEQVYSAVCAKLHEGMLLHHFRPLMSEGFRNGSFPGFITKVGKGGGIVATNSAVASKPIIMQTSVAARAVVLPEPTTIRVEPEVVAQALGGEIDASINAQSLMNAGVSANLLAKPDRPYLAATKKVVKAEPLKNTLYEPGAMFYLFIGEERFKVPCDPAYVKVLIEKVFGGVESAEGEVSFAGKRYSVQHTGILESMLLWFLNASILRGVVKKED